MTPGTKVRTRVSVKSAGAPAIPAGTVGTVVEVHDGIMRAVAVEFPGRFAHFYYRPDELETIQ